jgi:hypothetical protein
VVTSSGNATAIADKALAIAKLADGTDGELITWDASGVIAAVAAGNADQILTSNGAGAAPTFQAAAGGPSQANQAALEAETNEDTYAPPDLIKHSPGVAKAWCHITAIGGLDSPDYNVSSVTDTGAGDRTINFTVSFSGSEYAATATVENEGDHMHPAYRSPATGAVRFIVMDGSATKSDIISNNAIHGDQ